jgi:hypothetical protein
MHTQIADWFDISAVLKRTLAKVRVMRGGEARSLGGILLCIAAIVAMPAWYFDIHPTIVWMGDGPAALTSTLPGSVATLAPLLIVLLYLAPTLLGVGLPPLISAGFKFAELAHLFVAIFDATTDYPNVQATMDILWPRFDAMGPIVGWVLWHASFAILWAMATEGFELIFIVCTICGLVCLWNSLGNAQKGAVQS